MFLSAAIQPLFFAGTLRQSWYIKTINYRLLPPPPPLLMPPLPPKLPALLVRDEPIEEEKFEVDGLLKLLPDALLLLILLVDALLRLLVEALLLVDDLLRLLVDALLRLLVEALFLFAILLFTPLPDPLLPLP